MSQIDEARAQIRAAFAAAECPEELLEDPDAASRAWQAEAAALRGQAWQDLPAETADECGGALRYLSPAAFRYFLPAFLLRALDKLDAPKSCSAMIVLGLRSPIYGVWEPWREDERMLKRMAALDPAQRAAVQAFLHAVFSASTSFAMRYWAAEAMEYFWGPQTGPPAAARRAFFRELVSYRRPAAPEVEQERLIRLIERAFEQTPRPADDRIASPGHEDALEIAHFFRGLEWRHVHPDALALHSAALSFFTPEAFRYFLPAFLIADVLGAAGPADPVFHLAHFASQGGGPDAFDRDKLDRFSPTERQAIIAYLRYALQHGDGDREATAIATALDAYWLRPP